MLIRSRLLSTFTCVLVFAAALPLLAQSRERDYVRQDSARFRVWYCPEDEQVVRGLLREIAVRVPRVEQQLSLGLADTVAFVVAPSESEWYRLTAGAPLWANGIADPRRGVAILKSPRFGLPYGPLPVTAIHEYVHLLLQAGARDAQFPRWLDEGLAQLLAGQLDYMDNAVLGRAAAAGRLHTFARIEGLMSMNALEARQGYAESAVAVQLLQSRYGMAGISNLIHDLRSGSPFDDAFRRIFGISAGAFESEYFAHVQKTFRFSLLGDIELWVSAAFVLLVGAAGAAVWLRRRRILQRWREEEHPVSGGTAPPYTINYTLVRGRLHGSEDTPPSDEDRPPSDPPLPGN